MIITGSSSTYDVGKIVAETSVYRLYLCTQVETGDQCLLQVARDVGSNGPLDRSTYVIQKLLKYAERLEEEYSKVKSNPKHFLNYPLSFPEIVDTFVPENQGARRVNILRFRGVEDVRNIVPLHNLVNKDRLRVDLRTSIWILGKLLKTIAFVHDAEISINNLTLGNILIEPDKHYVIIFNWANAQLEHGDVPISTAREEVMNAARCVIEILNGTPETGIPDDGSPEHAAYESHLLHLANFGDSSALSAFNSFYSLVDSLWPRGFHHFTTLHRL